MNYTILSTDWTIYENRKNVCIQCKSVQEYKDNFPDAYNISVQNDELDYFFSKNGNCRKKNFWKNYDNRLTAAKLCQSRSEYAKRFYSAHEYSLKENEMDNFTWFNRETHPFDEDARIHLIYVYIDEENKYFYVGRTLNYNFKTRCSHHRSKNKHDVVFRHWNRMKKPVPDPIIVEENLNTLESKIKEHEYEELYISKGYKKLNISPTGERSSSIGGITKRWNKKTCYEAAKECNSRSEFSQKYSGAYQLSNRFGWMDDYTWFRTEITYEEAYTAACECKTIAEFKKKYKRYYEYFRRNRIIYKLPLEGKHIKITEKICRERAQLCKTRTEFKKKHNATWQYALDHNLMDELFGPNSHSLLSSYDQEIINKCIEKAKQFSCISQFNRNCGFEYRYLERYAEDILYEIFPKREVIEVTKENCYKYGAMCKNKTEFHNTYRQLYEYSKENNFIDDIPFNSSKDK